MYQQPVMAPAQPVMMAPAQPMMMQQPMMQQPMMAPQTNTNTNTNTNVNVVLGGGGGGKEKKEGPFPMTLPQFPCKGTCPQCKEYMTTAVVRKWPCWCWILFVWLALWCVIGWIILCCICSNEGNKQSVHRCARCGLFIGNDGDSPVVMVSG